MNSKNGAGAPVFMIVLAQPAVEDYLVPVNLDLPVV